MVKGKYIKKGKWCRGRIENPKKFAKGSFRTVSPNKNVRIIIACPKGKFNRKTKKCRVGTRAQAILKKPVKGRCPGGRPGGRHGHYKGRK